MDNPTTEEMERIVYEAITGECWHASIMLWPAKYGKHFWCPKCGLCLHWSEAIHVNNPPLSASLDEWAKHIWPVIREGARCNVVPWKYEETLNALIEVDEACILPYEATAMHHLTAAYKVVKGVK